MTYAELATTTNFSFLRGASHPEELVARAMALGMAGLGIADRNSVAGVVRAHVHLREHRETAPGFHLIVGARLVFRNGTPDILAYPVDRAAWGRLTRLLTRGNLRAQKGDCLLDFDDLADFAEGMRLIVMETASGEWRMANGEERRTVGALTFSRETGESGPAQRGRMRAVACLPPKMEATSQPSSVMLRMPPSPAPREKGERHRSPLATLHSLASLAPGRVWLAASLTYGSRARKNLAERAKLARKTGAPLIAVNDVIMHAPERRPLADVVTCVREGAAIDTAGRRLHVNAERHLKAPCEMARLFEEAPGAIAETIRFIDGVKFSLDDLRYEYPDEVREGFDSEQAALEHFARAGAKIRYPPGVPDKVEKALAHELALVAELNYAAYFLTVHDIVRFARGKGILCQGRGSAANSAICFCLGITEVDPTRHDLLFERFISAERREPPDIDVDFEHERREEVMQYIYNRYGRERAGLTAAVISYRGKSAIRETAKVFGFDDEDISKMSGAIIHGWREGVAPEKDLREAGFDPADPRLALMLTLAREIAGFPRHLSQHTGGFVITRARLDEVCPVANAAMEDRTTIEWDKDDLDALGILKIDVLALGMLSCLRRGFDLLKAHYGRALTLATIPFEDAATYRMIQRADTIGVFQIESRAQMSMLPRLKPKEFYDLVIEVAIVRPGPIQGDMVHPYLRRRQGLEEVIFPSAELEGVLGKTLGVPLFQEQAMKIAIVAAGFTPGEADKLRRAMATFKRVGTLHTFHDKMVEGMVARGYDRDFASRCFKQIEGFGSYGFPESHAASFALLVYASAWMKCRYPDVFACALLNSQPMGFYAPSQIVRDAREHGVEARPVDVNFSDWDCTLEARGERRVENGGSGGAGRPFSRATGEGGPRVSEGRMRVEALARPAGVENAAAPSSVSLREPPSPAEREKDAPATHSLSLHPRHADQRDDIHATHALRLGFREISGAREEDMRALVARRGGGYDSVRDVWLRGGLSPAAIERLAAADAFRSLGLDRRDALWAARGLNRAGDKDDLPLFARAASRESEPDMHLPPMPLGEHVVEDYRALSLSLKAHPVAFLRAFLNARGILRSEELAGLSFSRYAGEGGPRVSEGRMRAGPTTLTPQIREAASPSSVALRAPPSPAEREKGSRASRFPIVTVAGLVLVRQRPGSAKGVIFMTLEDETGVANAIIWPKVFERERAKVLGGRFVAITGVVQNEAGVIHVVADRVEDLTPMLSHLSSAGATISTLANADEGRRPQERPKLEDQARRRALADVARAMPGGRNFH